MTQTRPHRSVSARHHREWGMRNVGLGTGLPTGAGSPAERGWGGGGVASSRMQAAASAPPPPIPLRPPSAPTPYTQPVRSCANRCATTRRRAVD